MVVDWQDGGLSAAGEESKKGETVSDQNRHAIELFRAMVQEERSRQLAKWGPQSRTPSEWVVALAEEFGEVAKACCDQWTKGLSEYNESMQSMLTELVHTAATAEAIYADLYVPLVRDDDGAGEDER